MAERNQRELTGALKRSDVKKNVAAIHVSGKLTLLQRKLSNVLLLNAYDTLINNPTHRIDARTLCTMVGYNSNDMETLKASLRGLVETLAEWDMLDENGQQEWGVSSLLAYAKLKGGVCEYSYSSALAEKLHERLMGVEDSTYYEVFKHLNAKIIKPAVAEVNKTSNIILTPETRKMGRAVTDIRFKIARNPQLAILDLDDGEGLRNMPVYARLVGQGVSDRLARQWIDEHGEDYVSAKLDYVSGRTDVQNPIKYLSAAMRDGYGDEDAPKAAPPTSARAKRLTIVRDLVAKRSPTQRDADKRLFLARMTDDTARADFEKHGWMSAQCADAIFAFWGDLMPGAFDALMDA